MSEENEKEDYLEVDKPVPGQNYVCLSFISPEETLKQKELFMFSKYMTQQSGEYENSIDEIIKDSSDELRHEIGRKLKEKLSTSLKWNYDQFKSNYDDFKYKFNDELNTRFNKVCNNKTSIRGVKVRGVYDSLKEAENRAKELQRNDRSFHVFLGQVGYWLPWDPQADNVQNEEYLEDELNTLMKEYKTNEINKDLFYEEEKREKKKSALKEKLENDRKQSETIESMEEDDPWLKSKFSESTEATTNEETEATTNEATEATPEIVKEI